LSPEEEFKKYYRMPGWGKPLYEMKEAQIPKGEIPSAFDWRDKGTFLSSLNLQLHEIIYTLVLTRCLQPPFPLKKKCFHLIVFISPFCFVKT